MTYRERITSTALMDIVCDKIENLQSCRYYSDEVDLIRKYTSVIYQFLKEMPIKHEIDWEDTRAEIKKQVSTLMSELKKKEDNVGIVQIHIHDIVSNYYISSQLEKTRTDMSSQLEKTRTDMSSQLEKMRTENDGLKRELDEAWKDLDEARAVYEPRQALEKVVGGPDVEYKSQEFYAMIVHNTNGIRDIFERHFKDIKWNLPVLGNIPVTEWQGKFIGRIPVSTEIAKFAKQFYTEALSACSQVVHNKRPNSAPPFSSIVVPEKQFRFNQLILLDVVAEYLNKSVVRI